VHMGPSLVPEILTIDGFCSLYLWINVPHHRSSNQELIFSLSVGREHSVRVGGGLLLINGRDPPGHDKGNASVYAFLETKFGGVTHSKLGYIGGCRTYVHDRGVRFIDRFCKARA